MKDYKLSEVIELCDKYFHYGNCDKCPLFDKSRKYGGCILDLPPAIWDFEEKEQRYNVIEEVIEQ